MVYPKITTKKFDFTTYYGTSSRIVFVHFLGELKTPKGHFEINGPLEMGPKFVGSTSFHFKRYVVKNPLKHFSLTKLMVDLRPGMYIATLNFLD